MGLAKGIVFWVIAFLIVLATAYSAFSAGIVINEIMYNPEGDDNNREFIEVFHESANDTGWINLTGYIILDSSSSDMLRLVHYFNSSYSLIVEEGYNFSADSINASVYSVGATIGNGLSNSEENITLMDLDNVAAAESRYDGSIANGNGLSMEFNGSAFAESAIVGGTPGYGNSVLNQFPGIVKIDIARKLI